MDVGHSCTPSTALSVCQSALPSKHTDISLQCNSTQNYGPISNPLLTELGPSSQVLQLLEASRKYAIAPVMDTCKEYLRKHHLPKDPMGVYVIACKYGMEDLARTAAIGTLGESQEKVLDCNRPETGAVTFACVQRLRAFRKECQTTICALLDITACVAWPSVQKLFEGTTPMPAPVGQPYGSAQAGYATYPTCCFTSTFTIGGANVVVVRDWWLGYAKELRKIFANVRTTGWQVAAQEEAYVETLKTVMKCAVCRKSNLKYLESFKIEVQQKLTQTVHAVS